MGHPAVVAGARRPTTNSSFRPKRSEVEKPAGKSSATTDFIERDALEFERAVKVQACSADDLHMIAIDCRLHVSTTGTELLRAQRVLTQPPRPIWSQCAVYRACCRVLIDALRRRKKSAHVIHVTLAGSGNNCAAIYDVQFGKSG